MALIVRGETKTISKEEMKKLVEDLKKNPDDDAFEGLSPAKKEIRKEIQDAKRHREFMHRVAQNEERDLQNVIATSEIVTIAVGETVSTIEELTELPEVDFESMTKKQIDEWAEENLGIQLDRRRTKARLIAEVKENL
jgi:ribosomal protein S20